MKTMKAMQSLWHVAGSYYHVPYRPSPLCLGSIEPLLDMYSHLLRLSVLALSSHTLVF